MASNIYTCENSIGMHEMVETKPVLETLFLSKIGPLSKG